MNNDLRNYFDRQLERVLETLPMYVRDLLHQVPLIVDDYPTPEVLRQLKSRRQGDLCGLYQGVPLTEHSIEHSGHPASIIRLFREAIIAEAKHEFGELTDDSLGRMIRIVILHELGHHHGLDEDELEQLGY